MASDPEEVLLPPESRATRLGSAHRRLALLISLVIGRVVCFKDVHPMTANDNQHRPPIQAHVRQAHEVEKQLAAHDLPWERSL